jgi:acyl-CoA thioester hydrolase
MTATADLPKHSVAIKVPFHDLDPVGIVWHGNYAKYFEIARCALLETFNYNYDQMAASGFAWPIIDLHLRYVKAARFGEMLDVQATLREWEHRLRIDSRDQRRGCASARHEHPGRGRHETGRC